MIQVAIGMVLELVLFVGKHAIPLKAAKNDEYLSDVEVFLPKNRDGHKT